MTTPATQSTALALFQDTLSPEELADLLRTQKESITSNIALPQVKMLAAGACQFELSDDEGTTFPVFTGIILHMHSSNVLWDSKMEEQFPPDDPRNFPACASSDGIVGIPRVGFAHAGLKGEVGDGVKTVQCKTCPYNQFRSGNMLIAEKNEKGKAVTNNRRVFIAMEGRSAPVELVLPPTSLRAFDEYCARLTNQNIPVQAVVTEFRQVKEGTGRNQYGVLSVKSLGLVTREQFEAAKQMRTEFWSSITPKSPEELVAEMAKDPNADIPDAQVSGADDDSDLPF